MIKILLSKKIIIKIKIPSLDISMKIKVRFLMNNKWLTNLKLVKIILIIATKKILFWILKTNFKKWKTKPHNIKISKACQLIKLWWKREINKII
jgi:hypothetical protein